MSLLRTTRGRANRRGFPISAFCGPNGGGKSAAMVWDTLPTLDAGRPVLSTVRLLDYRNPRPCEGWWGTSEATGSPCPQCLDGSGRPHGQAHPMWVPFTQWTQLLEAEHCDVLMDEVTGVASSRDSGSLPSVVANFLVQLRRRDIVLRWSAPNWARADVIIRECTQAVTVCRGFMPKAVPVDGEDTSRMWRHRRLFKWVTYDASLFTDFTEGKRAELKPWVLDVHWGPGSPSFSAYDTFDAVSMIHGVAGEGAHGPCLICGGLRRRPQCKGHDGEETPARGEARAPLAGAPDLERTDPPAEPPALVVVETSQAG